MIFIVLFIFAFICSSIASSKGYGAGIWFTLGMVFGIFSFFVVLFLPDKRE